jgi:enoyl-CoA hydratase
LFKNIKYIVEDNVGTILIDRPKSLNSLTKNTLEEIDDVLDTLSTKIKVLIITGAGEKAFVAGADIKEMREFSPEDALNYVKFGHSVISKIENINIPVIAVINGYCLGGGLELAMACDIRIASEKARFGQPEVGLGIIPGFGGTQRLPRLIGKGIAMEMLITGQIIDASKAYQIGLINYLTKPEDLLEKSYQIVNNILTKSSKSIRKVKEAVNNGVQMGLVEALNYEAQLFSYCFTEDDQNEGFNAYFEKRKPNFK